MDLNGAHFTLGGLAAFATAIWAILRLINSIRPWFEWRRKAEIIHRVLIMHAPEDARKQIEELLK